MAINHEFIPWSKTLIFQILKVNVFRKNEKNENNIIAHTSLYPELHEIINILLYIINCFRAVRNQIKELYFSVKIRSLLVDLYTNLRTKINYYVII